MSLLLDALRSTDSDEPPPAPMQEDLLDAPAVLDLLTEKSAATGALTLEPRSAGISTSADGPTAETPREPAATSRQVAAVIRPPATTPSEPGVAAPLDLGSRPTNAGLGSVAPPAVSRTLKYGMMLGAAVAVVAIVLFGKSLLLPNPTPIIYPEVEQNPPVAATLPATAAGSLPVQVPSTRPAGQFAYAGDAPEIDLHDGDAPPTAIRSTPRPAENVWRPEAGIASAPGEASTTMAPATAMVPPSAPRPVAPAAARSMALAPSTAAGTLSVARSEGLSSIDRHIEAGYRALAAGNVATAQSEYFAALELDPNNVDALMGTASAAARDGNATVATAAYAKVLRLEPGNPDATAAMAMLSHSGAANEVNESRLKTMIATDTDSRPALHTALAAVYAADGRWTEAAQEYFTALSKDPGNADLAFDVAASLDQNRNGAAALTYYEQALDFAKLRPSQIDGHAVEQRISQLRARVEVRAASVREAP
jgi:Flp pilus assembly protein TadD